MSNMLYLECASGISGDMFVGAMLDLGADQAKLEAALASLPVDGYEIRISRMKKSALDACDFDVVLDAAHENHDHDMEYLHGHDHGHGHDHHHGHDHGHDHHHGHDHSDEPERVCRTCEGLSESSDFMAQLAAEQGYNDPCVVLHGHRAGTLEPAEPSDVEHMHVAAGEGDYTLSSPEHHHHHYDHDHEHGHGHHHHHHDHEHRSPADIDAIIDAGDLTDNARAIAKRIFAIIAKAEAKAHGVSVDQVHFHEVGAVDSIVDIVAAAVCVDDLGISECVVPALHEGKGTVRCQHGILPVPVPAVASIAADEGLTFTFMDLEGEFVTPTGAAIAAALRTRDALPVRFTIDKVGIGAGKRTYERPSILRAMLVHDAGDPQATLDKDMTPPFIWKLETEIDDCSGEQLAYALERLLAEGALEAHYAPVFMKKNRPAYQIEVLCREADIPKMENVLFKETTTIGIRRIPMERTPLPRTQKTVATPYGDIRVKEVALPDGTLRAYPEYDSVSEAARTQNVPYQDVYAAAYTAAK
ncbi:nickel pincer cofactor biosynthesis protein LarC [Slackia heliotrinireducens]|uniref:nickel pincer cofactor biosynthesis protein LarC n=1 Tax=Slackia heliotrinireducens TaxID=84110 RepID=UPI0033161E9E